ncbi:MAG: hypothetical protein ACO1RA_03100 [Planctomycetaceae bacterium]
MKKPTLCRRLLQFRLRTLMFAMLLLPIGLGWLANARSKSQKAWDNVEEIKKMGNTSNAWDRHASPWWQRTLGIDLPANVTELWVDFPDFNEQKQAQLLTRLHAFPHLKKLDITNPCRTAHALVPLAYFQELEALELLGGEVSYLEVEVAVIAELPRLKSYHDEGMGISSKSANILASMESLEELSFWRMGPWVSSDFDWAKLKNLRRLSCHITSFKAYATHHGEFIVYHVNEDIAQIAKLENLESLKLEMTDCTDDGLPPLLQLKNLQHLTLESDDLTDACLATLVELPALKTLELKGKNLTQEAVDQWQAKRPDLTITKK